MPKIGVYEAKARLSELLTRVEAGEEITITNHGRAVARLVAVDDDERENRRILIARTREMRSTLMTGRFSLRKVIEEGRRGWRS